DHGPQQYQQDHGPQQYQQDHGPQQYQQDHGPQQYHDSQRGPMGPGNMDHQDNHGGDSGWGHDNHRWSRGEHYDGQRYVVHHDDWDRYHLHAPPPGYEWVRSGDQFVMIAIASGIIASIIVGSAYGN
ncbi:MAG: RcnB family protein, partial [Rhodospirillales bacterium]|nr:RcnB family protein [Rhodospirillales bacterium]